MQKMTHLKNSFFGITSLAVSACTGETPPVTIDYPEAGSAATQLYLAKCDDCHRAPQPTAHTATTWPGVLQRMQMRMQAKARKPLDKDELGLILDYLQRNAGEGRQP